MERMWSSNIFIPNENINLCKFFHFEAKAKKCSSSGSRVTFSHINLYLTLVILFTFVIFRTVWIWVSCRKNCWKAIYPDWLYVYALWKIKRKREREGGIFYVRYWVKSRVFRDPSNSITFFSKYEQDVGDIEKLTLWNARRMKRSNLQMHRDRQ